MLLSELFPSLSGLRPVVRVRVEAVPAHGAFALDELPPHERARMGSFASAERRRQFVLGRLAARRLIGHQLGRAPREIEIEVGNDGAPHIQPGFLSIAHGGRGLGALGLAALADVPVGIDAETIRPRHPGLGRRITGPDESSVVGALGGPTASSLTLLWALKESVLKGQRTGLRAGARSVQLRQVDVSGDSGTAVAEADHSGTWRLAFSRQRNLWVTVAWQEAEGVSPEKS